MDLILIRCTPSGTKSDRSLAQRADSAERSPYPFAVLCSGERFSIAVGRQRYTDLGCRQNVYPQRIFLQNGLCNLFEMLVVRQEDHLDLARKFDQHLERSGGPVIVEVDEQVIRDERERLGPTH